MLMKNCDKSNIKNIESILRSDKIKSLITNNGMTSNVYTDYITDDYAVTHFVIGDQVGDVSDFMIDIKNAVQDSIGIPVRYNYVSPTSKSLVISYNPATLNELQIKKRDNEGVSQSIAIQYQTKASDILNTPKADQIFAKGNKNNWSIDKILTELQIPKEEKDLILQSGYTTKEDILMNLMSYEYPIDIKVTKGKGLSTDEDFVEEMMMTGQRRNFDTPPKSENTQHYSNLTVPGGTNYTENEIATPQITPSIKGHAQFATDNGIGWFRSDDKATEYKGFKKDNDWLDSESAVTNVIEPSDKIIFGHPTIGKTFLKESGNNDFISLDDDYGQEIKDFVNSHKGSLDKYQYQESKPKEFIDFTLALYDRVKFEAKKQNKKLFTSNNIILENRMSDFDKVINLDSDEFFKRIAKRNTTYDVKAWKSQIDSLISKVDSNKVITTKNYLSDLINLQVKTRRILEVQSDLFQKGRDKEDLISHSYNNENEVDRLYALAQSENWSAEKLDKQLEGHEPNEKENNFLQLLNKNNNWVTYFTKAIIQDSISEGYEKVLFPRLDTIIQIESAGKFKTYEEASSYYNNSTNWIQKEKELDEEIEEIKKDIESIKKSDKNEYPYGNKILTKQEELERQNSYLIKAKEERASNRPTLLNTAKFYENDIANILKKQGFKPVEITDEYGNGWYEINLEGVNTGIRLREDKETIENLVGNVLSTSDSISVNKQISKAEADDNQIIARTKAKINRLKSTLTRPGINKYFVQSKIDNYNKELEDYKESETIQDKLEVLTNIARMDVEDAKEALKNPNSLNASEIRDIIATGDIWSNFRDILGVSELNEEVEKIQSDASQIKHDILNVTTDFILEASKGSKFNLTVEDMTMMKDSKWMLNILDIKNSDQKFIRYLGSAIERVNIAKELSIKEKWKKSDELFSKIKREDYKKLFKTDAAGRTLWNHLIYELDDSFIGTRKELSGYADAFYKESDKEDISDYIKLYLDGDMDKANRAKKQLIEDKISTEEILDSVIKGVEEGRKEPSYTNDELTFQGLNAGSKEARRLKNQWFVDNTIAIDPIAFAEGTTEEERDRLIEEFYNKVGEKNKHYAMSMVDLAQAKIKQYYEEQEQYKDWLEDTYIDNPELAEEEMKLWEYRHNPFLYYNITYNPSALPEDTDMEAINQTKDKDKLRYVPYAPVGDQHYNPKFKEMLANKDLFAVYDFVNSYMRAAVKRLPKDIRGNTNADFVMRSKAGAWEAFKANGYKPVQGLDGATDWFSVNHSYQFDNEVDELGNPLNKVRFDKFFDVDARIDEVERLLEQPGITDSERKIYQQELKELNKGFSTDLQSTMQMIIHEVETYKYLDDISDAVELQRYIVNQAKEITNDGYRNDGLNLIKKAVNYTFDAMVYGKYRKEPDQNQKQDFWADNVYEFKDLFGLTSEKKKQAKKIKDNAKGMEPMFEAAMLKQKAGEKLTKDEKDVITSYKNLYRDYKALGGKRSSFTKIADSAIALTQAKSMGFSILSPLTNLNFGLASNYMEAIGGLYFNVKEAHAAFKEMLSTTKNFGSLGKAKSSDKRNKIVNFFENNNLIKDMMESHYGKGQIVNTEKMYTWMRSSDFFMKGQTIVASLMHDKVKMKDGSEKSMWSLINTDGTVNSDEIENWNSESQIDLIQKLNAIVKRTHGNTDPNSPVWIKSEVLGRLLGQFKLSWITEGINSRFGVSRPDEITGVKVQGRYVAIPRMFKEYNNFLRNSGAGSTMERWKDAFTNLDKVDQADIRKIAAEMIFFLSLWGMMIGLKMLKAELDDDDKFSKGSATLALNLIYRLRSDISFYALPGTLSDVIRNPVPALRVWTDFSKAAWSTVEVLNPINDTDQEDINRLGRNWAKTLPPLRSGVSIYKSTVDSYEDYNSQ